jgi:hypothetical protein
LKRKENKMTREARDESRETKGRTKRVPLGKGRLKLTTTNRTPPDKVDRWFNDDPGRLQEALEAGYVFVKDPEAVVGEGTENERDGMTTAICRSAGSRRDGNPRKMYLMRQDKAVYDADQAAKVKANEKREETIRRNLVPGPQGEQHDGSHRYSPEGIKIEHPRKQQT